VESTGESWKNEKMIDSNVQNPQKKLTIRRKLEEACEIQGLSRKHWCFFRQLWEMVEAKMLGKLECVVEISPTSGSRCGSSPKSWKVWF
jgi:hypothetical protein